MQLAHKNPNLTITVCGGGSGTDGQSLTAGIVVDCSKYLNHIIEINLQENWVRAEAGVVMDQLNDALKPHGVFVPVHISTGNRATLGGMVNTDACGKGSLRYGRMSDHLLECHAVLSDATTHVFSEKNAAACEALKKTNRHYRKYLYSSNIYLTNPYRVN